MSTNLIQLQDPSDVIADASTNPALQSWGYSVSQPLPGDLGTAQNPYLSNLPLLDPSTGQPLPSSTPSASPSIILYVGIFAALLILIAVGGKR